MTQQAHGNLVITQLAICFYLSREFSETIYLEQALMSRSIWLTSRQDCGSFSWQRRSVMIMTLDVYFIGLSDPQFLLSYTPTCVSLPTLGPTRNFCLIALEIQQRSASLRKRAGCHQSRYPCHSEDTQQCLSCLLMIASCSTSYTRETETRASCRRCYSFMV